MAAPSVVELDERQREAVEHVRGPMLVVAGAGTGKTTVLIQRMARLIREHGVRPDEILALTYADNAAKEMGQRVRAELRGASLSGLQTETFHAYCYKLLERHGKQFRLLEDADLWIYLFRRIRALQLKYFVRAANTAQFLLDLIDFMRRCQDELVTPEKYGEYIRRVESGEEPVPRVAKSKRGNELTRDEVQERCREIASVFQTVERMLQEDNLGTFGHQITRAYSLLCDEPGILAHERKRARFILADEFQDANFAQVKILQTLAGEERNVFAVGDPDQAIYRFRGASSAAFGLFQRNFEGARLVVLERNRRSTTPILRVAFATIANNPGSSPRRRGRWWPTSARNWCQREKTRRERQGENSDLRQWTLPWLTGPWKARTWCQLSRRRSGRCVARGTGSLCCTGSTRIGTRSRGSCRRRGFHSRSRTWM